MDQAFRAAVHSQQKAKELKALERELASRLARTPYVLLLSFPDVNVVSAADFAGEMGPIGKDGPGVVLLVSSQESFTGQGVRYRIEPRGRRGPDKPPGLLTARPRSSRPSEVQSAPPPPA